MPIEAKEVLTYLGAPETLENIDDLANFVKKEYVRISLLEDHKSDEYKRVMPGLVGKITGTSMTKLNRSLKEYGAELTPEEVKDKPIEEVIEIGVKKLATLKENSINELKGQIGKGSEELVASWQEKLTKAEQKAKDFEDRLTVVQKQATDIQATAGAQFKEYKKNLKYKDLIASAKIKPTASELEKIGFVKHIEDNYKFDLTDGENEELEIFTKDGKRIPHEKVNGKFKTPAEVMDELVTKLGLAAGNPHGQRPTRPTPFKVGDEKNNSGGANSPTDFRRFVNNRRG